MTDEQAFEIWAPMDAVWSPWAKPVLFAHPSARAANRAPKLFTSPAPSTIASAPASTEPSASAGAQAPTLPTDVSWAPTGSQRTAIVLELPGLVAIEHGLALLDKGYRPVPLFNSSIGPMPVVPADVLRSALLGACDQLSRARLPDDAPPAFLLDTQRRGSGNPQPGRFDNRWMVFPQDLPSANFLLSQRIESVLLVMTEKASVADDLAHVLLRWKEGGLALARKNLEGGSVQVLDVSRPRGFRSAWYFALVAIGLRRSAAGGFGSVVPMPSQGGGFA